MSAPAGPLALSVRGVGKRFAGPDGSVAALEQVDLDVRAGEFVTLIGPSSCGKSILFNIVAGLVEQDDGTVALGG